MAGLALGSESGVVAACASVVAVAAGIYLAAAGVGLIPALAPAALSLAAWSQFGSFLSWRVAFILLLAPAALIGPGVRASLLDVVKLIAAPPRVSIAVVATVCVSLVAGCALIVNVLGDDDVLFVFGPQLSLTVVLAVAVLNAVLEEFVWRGVFTHSLQGLGVGIASTALITSSSFGLAHFSGGYPSGLVGSALAATLGLVNSFLARRTGSLVLPIGLHATFDAIILTHIYG